MHVVWSGVKRRKTLRMLSSVPPPRPVYPFSCSMMSCATTRALQSTPCPASQRQHLQYLEPLGPMAHTDLPSPKLQAWTATA